MLTLTVQFAAGSKGAHDTRDHAAHLAPRGQAGAVPERRLHQRVHSRDVPGAKSGLGESA